MPFLRRRRRPTLPDVIAERIAGDAGAGDLVDELIVALAVADIEALDTAIREQRNQELAQLREHGVLQAGFDRSCEAPGQPQRRVHRTGTGHSEARALRLVQALNPGSPAGG